MLRCVFLGLLLGSIHSLQGQSHYITTSFYLSDSSNTGFIPNNQKSIQEVLIEGFLSGKLKGYPYSVKVTPVYSEEPNWPQPLKWEAGKEYFLDDTVTYQGAFFRVINDYTKDEPTRDDEFSWIKYDRKQMRYYTYQWPSASDILTAEDFNTQRLIQIGANSDTWNSDYTYYTMDEVVYKGNIYQAERDKLTGIVPGDSDAWLLLHSATAIIDARGFSALTMLNHEDLKGVATPQILMLSPEEEYYWGRVVCFYYQEALDYLKSINEPLYVNPYSASSWWGGSLFNPNPESSMALGSMLLRHLDEKKINPSKIRKRDPAIAKQNLYAEEDYTAVPQLKSGKIISLNLITRSVNYEIPLSTFLKVMKSEQPDYPFTKYSEALIHGSLVNGRRDTVEYPGLVPLKSDLTNSSCNQVRSRQSFQLSSLDKSNELSEFVFSLTDQGLIKFFGDGELSFTIDPEVWKQIIHESGDTLASKDFKYFKLLYDVTYTVAGLQSDYKLVALGIYAMNPSAGFLTGGYVNLNDLTEKIGSSSMPALLKKKIFLQLNEIQNGKPSMVRQELVSGLQCVD